MLGETDEIVMGSGVDLVAGFFGVEQTRWS